MASLENPNPRETFDKNEAGIAQTKQAIAEAAAAGDYDKVGALAQEAKNMEATKSEMVDSAHGEALEINDKVDEARATQEKARRQIELAEQSKIQAEKDSREAAQLLEKLTGKNVGASPTENAEATVATPDVQSEIPVAEPAPSIQEAPAVEQSPLAQPEAEAQFDTSGTRMWEELKEIYPQGIPSATRHRYNKFLERLADQVSEGKTTKEAASEELETSVGNLRAAVDSLEGKDPGELTSEAATLKKELLGLFYHDKSQLKSEYSDPWKVVPENIRTTFDNTFGQVFEKTGASDYIQAKAKLEELRALVAGQRNK